MGPINFPFSYEASCGVGIICAAKSCKLVQLWSLAMTEAFVTRVRKTQWTQALITGTAKLETSLDRCFTFWDLVLMGFCTMIGTGIYVIAGEVQVLK